MNKTFNGGFLNGKQNQTLQKVSSTNNLPTISLNQLYTQLNGIRKKKNLNQTLTDFKPSNFKQFNVCSPFYDRMKTHKPNCKCLYHRKKPFQIFPVRHTHKPQRILYSSLDKELKQNLQQRNFRLSNKQNNQNKTQIKFQKNTQLQQQHRYFHTISQNVKTKVNSRNFSYDQFLKDCQHFILRKKGNHTIQSPHVIRKAARQIFDFMNKNIQYSVEKMSKWVDNIQKDRDYGQFYIDRFRQMKHNYEQNIKKGKVKKSTNFSNLYNLRNKKIATEKVKSKVKLKDKKPSEEERSSSSGQSQSQKTDQEQSNSLQQQKNQSDSDYSSSNSSSKQITLQKIIQQIKNNNKLSQKDLNKIVNLNSNTFKKLFSSLQKNIQNDKYDQDVLKKIQNGCLNQLLKKLSTYYNPNNSSNNKLSTASSYQKIPPQKGKTDLITQTIHFIRKYRNKKVSLTLDGRNSTNSAGSKTFFGSKRNTQNGQNPNKTTNSLSCKKPTSAQGSNQSSQTTLNEISKTQENTQNNFQAIQQQNQNQQDNLHGQQKILKNILNHGQNVRRSKLIKEQMFKFKQDDKMLKTQTQEDDQHEPQKTHILEHQKGFLKKAQRYLFEVNMGKTIVNDNDSIFTAKRKVRVIKMLLKQNPNTPEAQQLLNYIKLVQQRCFQKTQKDKKLNLIKKISQNDQLQDQDIWKLLTLDDMGYNLIFYNLTSKIRIQDNQDLCILLHQMKLNNTKKLQNQVTFKSHLYLESEPKKQKTKVKNNDILIQQDMRNMEFQPQIQQKQQNVQNQTKRTTKTYKTVYNPGLIFKQSRLNGFTNNSMGEIVFPNQNLLNRTKLLSDQNSRLIFSDKQYIKKLLKYAKDNLPQTFQTYLNNLSYLQQQERQLLPQQIYSSKSSL